MSSIFALSRRAALGGAIVLAFASRANAQAVAPEVARKYIETLGNQVVDIVASTRSAVDRRAAFIRIMLASLDFEQIGNSALGKLARQATQEQKRDFRPLFAAYVIDVAVEKFGNLQQMRFGLGKATPQPNGDVKVYTRVDTGEKPMEVYWRVRDDGGRPRISDIEVEGASLAIHYRGEFERTGVATVPQLIARLKELTKSSGTVTITQQAMR